MTAVSDHWTYVDIHIHARYDSLTIHDSNLTGLWTQGTAALSVMSQHGWYWLPAEFMVFTVLPSSHPRACELRSKLATWDTQKHPSYCMSSSAYVSQHNSADDGAALPCR